jgi:hypothetical protein
MLAALWDPSGFCSCLHVQTFEDRDDILPVRHNVTSLTRMHIFFLTM